MSQIFQRIWSFDRLIGPVLVKIVYYVGFVVIALGAVGVLFSAVLSIFAGNLGLGAMQLLAAPAVGVAALVYWRFLCELFMLAFLGYERLGEVRRLLAAATGSAPDPNHPEF